MPTLREILEKTAFLIISDPSSDSNYNRIKKIINDNLGIEGISIKKFPSVMIKSNPSLGCNLSHAGATSEYPDYGYLCVIEDDADLFEWFNHTTLDLEIPHNYLEKCDCMYLGISSWGYSESSPTKAKLNSLIWEKSDCLPDIFIRVFNMFSAHAILYLNKSYAELISSGIKKSSIPYYIEPNDITNARSQYDNFCLALKTPIFYQRGEHEYCTKIILNETHR